MCCLCVTRPIYHVRLERDHPFSSCLNSHSFFSFLFYSGSSPLVVLVILLSLEESMLQKLCCHVLCIIYYVDFKRERESYSKISCNFFCSLFVLQGPVANCRTLGEERGSSRVSTRCASMKRPSISRANVWKVTENIISSKKSK